MNQFTNGDSQTTRGAVPNSLAQFESLPSEFHCREGAVDPDAFVSLIATIQRSDRWQVYRRLKNLGIACWCPSDGTLWVEVNGCVGATLLRSTVQQFTHSRLELADWLDRCWTTSISILSTTHH